MNRGRRDGLFSQFLGNNQSDKRSTGPRHVKLGRDRRLRFEQCEARNLLAVIAPGTITGVKYVTENNSGFSANDVPQAGVWIDLYKDNGDGLFDATTDTLADRQQTADPTGAYAFNNVADGHYYIQEEVPTGYTQSAGPAFYTLDVIGGSVYTGTALNIDDFSDPDPEDAWIIGGIDPNPLLLQESGGGIIGGERDLLVNVLGAPNATSAQGTVGTVSPNNGVLNFGSAPVAPGAELALQYDGVDVDTVALNDAGLLGANLTAGGNNGLRLDFNFLQTGDNTAVGLTVSATGPNPGETATFTTSVSPNAGGFSLFLPFASFTVAGGFDFAAVASLKIDFNQAGKVDVDFELDQIVDVQQRDSGFNFGNFPKPSSLSGNVYVDCNDNGIFDSGETPIADVTITLTGTNDLGQAVNLVTTTNASGAYTFGNLRPGVYALTETQPAGFTDGQDTIGTPGGTTGNDTFTNINLLPDVQGANNNFGEMSADCGCTKPPKPCDPKPCDPKPCDPKPCPPKSCNPPPTHTPQGGCQSKPTSSKKCDTKPKTCPTTPASTSNGSKQCGPKSTPPASSSSSSKACNSKSTSPSTGSTSNSKSSDSQKSCKSNPTTPAPASSSAAKSASDSTSNKGKR